MAWLDACKLMIGDHVTKTADSEQSRAFRGNGDSDGICMAEVEVDIETGVVKVIKLVNAQQVGKAINRKLVESQIVGAAIQGISFALFEDRILNEVNGAGVNPNMEWYKIAGPCDMPEIVPIIDSPDDYTGARAAGEPPIVGVPGAIGNAVANAIGKRVYSMPITPAKVLAALA
jgi:xanthine dehydrogenase YagR molybdenum-binding subunit